MVVHGSTRTGWTDWVSYNSEVTQSSHCWYTERERETYLMWSEWYKHSNATRQRHVDQWLRSAWYQCSLLQRHHQLTDVEVNHHVRLHTRTPSLSLVHSTSTPLSTLYEYTTVYTPQAHHCVHSMSTPLCTLHKHTTVYTQLNQNNQKTEHIATKTNNT